MPFRYETLSSHQLQAHARKGALPVLPVGSLEQHCNAPLGTDTIIAVAVASRACSLLEARTGRACILLPPLYYGFSPEWNAHPGTVTVPQDALRALLWSILDGLRNTGFDRAAIVNGHGGNTSLLEASAREWASRNPGFTVGLVDYWRPLGLRLGHCDRLEESLLSEILGARIECACQKRHSLSAGGSRIISIPVEPQHGSLGFDSGGTTGATLEAIAGAVAGELERLLEWRGPSL